MRNITERVILVLVLVGTPALRASAADAGELSTPPPSSDRAAVVPAPEAELHALEDTLRSYGRAGSAAEIALPSSASSAAKRTTVSAAEAELRALDDTVARSTERFGRREATARARTSLDRERTNVVSAPEAELEALLAWQRPEALSAPGLNDSAERGGARAQLERSRRAEHCTCTCTR